MSYQSVVRPLLFRLGGGDAETAHTATLRALARLSEHPRVLAVMRRRFQVAAPVRLFGLRFANRVGLAAGVDKDGIAVAAWPALGFGFVELGTVTHHPQPGNPRPRLFRLARSEAVINRMGFNNAGAAALAGRLAARSALRGSAEGLAPASMEEPAATPIGISIGKSKIVELGDAVGDYVASFRLLHRYGDYFAINVSSPNTPGLRALQDRGLLDELVTALRHEALTLGVDKPLLVKIAPDLAESAIAEVLEVCLARGAAGVIATNTTTAREGLAEVDVRDAGQSGGLSGRPLAGRAREVVSFIHRETAGHLPIIGVGGIVDPSDAQRMIDAGAGLVQIYTGFIYRGPGLVRGCARALAGRG